MCLGVCVSCLQLEEAKIDDCRLALVFSSTGLPLNLGIEMLNSMETRFDIIFPNVLEKNSFFAEVWHSSAGASCHAPCRRRDARPRSVVNSC